MRQIMIEIEREYAALMADVMISETDLIKRTKKIEALQKQEVENKESIKEIIKDMQAIIKLRDDYARVLDISTQDANLIMNYRELKAIHWHLDNPNK